MFGTPCRALIITSARSYCDPSCLFVCSFICLCVCEHDYLCIHEFVNISKACMGALAPSTSQRCGRCSTATFANIRENFLGPLPKTLAAQNKNIKISARFQRTLSRMSPKLNKISSNGNRRCKLRSPLRMLQKN